MQFSLSIESIPGEIIVLWSDQTILTEKEELYTIFKYYAIIIAPL